MTILCGTDFSENADTAARAAGSIAKRLALPLKLVHVVDPPGAADEPLRTRLRAQAEGLQKQFGINI